MNIDAAYAKAQEIDWIADDETRAERAETMAHLRAVIEAALQPEPGSIPVRVCIAVGKRHDGADVYNAAGWTGADDDDLREASTDLSSAVDAQFRWLVGEVRPWQQPEEPETMGSEE